MKNNVKKALLISTTAVASGTAIVTPVVNEANVDKTVKNEKTKINQERQNVTNEIVYNDKVYSSVNDIVEDFLTQQGVVTQKMYLGDVADATSRDEYNTVNLNKLKEVTASNITPAYKTLSDSYTNDINEAKKSYLQNPVIKWGDKNGNLFDSEWEAKRAMESNGEKYTSSVGYYEVKDYSRKNEFNLPTTVKINPLNKQDNEQLKQIAARNILDTNSNFNIKRFAVENNNYQENQFNGWTDALIHDTVNNEIDKIFKTVTDNMHFETRIEKYYPGASHWFENISRSGFGLDAMFAFSNTSHIYKVTVFQDQQYFNDKNMKPKFQEHANIVKTQTENSLNQIFKTLGFENNETKTFVSTAANIFSQLITTKLLDYETEKSPLLPYKQARDWAQNFVDNIVMSTFNDALRKAGQSTMYDILKKYYNLKYQSQDQNKNNDSIYVITYNDAPLYKVNKQVFSPIFNTEGFRVNPLDAIKSFISNQLQTNYNNFTSSLSNNLTNISNNFKFDRNNKIVLTKNTIDNYNNGNVDNNIKLDNNSSNPNFDSNVKMFDTSVFAENNINVNQLEKQLNRREDDNVANLNSQYGTFQAIYQYNKNLVKAFENKEASDTLKNNVAKNAMTNPNDIVVLYEKNNVPATIKYGEYLNYGYKFNESLSSNNIRVLNSDEKRRYEINAENLTEPTKQYTYFDYNGNVLLSETVEATNGSYDLAASQVYNNALNKIVVPASSSFVFYTGLDGRKELVKNQTSKLNILTITKNNKTYKYGFTRYADLYNYASNYILDEVTLNTVTGNDLFQSRSVMPAMMSGIVTSIAIILIAEVVVLSFALVKKNKKMSINANPYYNMKK